MGGRAMLMKRSRRITSRKNKNQKHVAVMPRELIVDVLSRVASSSFIDFINAKLSCNIFNGVSEDDYIYKHVSLEKFPLIPWRPVSEEAVTFLKRCKQCENPESLYRQGLIDYFKDNKLESGRRYLEKAAKKGHMGALYVLGIILLHCEDESKAIGIKIISELKKSNTSRQVKDYRDNLRALRSKIWPRSDGILFGEKPTCCTLTGHKKLNAWDVHSRYLHLDQCEACQCDLELSLLSTPVNPLNSQL